jgi:purine-binding chemotaxis protein CheW
LTTSPFGLKLVFRCDSYICALALSDVVETLRPRPIKEVSGAPAGVCGIAVVRGKPVVVVDLATLLGGPEGKRTRWVLIRCGERRVALRVDAVLGVREFDPKIWQDLPPLLADAGSGMIEALGARDKELTLALRAGNIVPEAAWETLAGQAV